MNKPVSGKERKAKHDAKQRGMGRRRVEFWLTTSEKAHLLARLLEVRANQ